MNSKLKSILTILALALAFVLGGVGAFHGLLFLDSRIMHDQDGQAVGINFFLLAFAAGAACTVGVGILIGRCFWRPPSPPEDGCSKEPRS